MIVRDSTRRAATDRDRVTPYLLVAALRVGELVDSEGSSIETLRASYPLIPTGGLYHSEDLIHGERLLTLTGLVEIRDGSLVPTDGLHAMLKLDEAQAQELLLSLYLEKQAPLWTEVAIGSEHVSDELIPDAESDLISTTVPDSDRREALLLAAAQRVDPGANRAQGEAGENHVVEVARRELVEAGHPELADKVQRVSLISDALGYDVIAPTVAGRPRRLEVKTTKGQGKRVDIYLSRNEALVGLRDSTWYLVLCSLSGDTVDVVGWLQGDYLRPHLPLDQSERGKWTSTRITLLLDDLNPGIPSLTNAA